MCRSAESCPFGFPRWSRRSRTFVEGDVAQFSHQGFLLWRRPAWCPRLCISGPVFILRFSAYPQTFSPPNFRRPDGRQFFKIHIVNNQEFLFCGLSPPQAEIFELLWLYKPKITFLRDKSQHSQSTIFQNLWIRIHKYFGVSPNFLKFGDIYPQIKTLSTVCDR